MPASAPEITVYFDTRQTHSNASKVIIIIVIIIIVIIIIVRFVKQSYRGASGGVNQAA